MAGADESNVLQFTQHTHLKFFGLPRNIKKTCKISANSEQKSEKET
jgi:hypothetical protein